MKNIYSLLSFAVIFAFFLHSCDKTDDISESIENKSENAKEKCTTIQSGELMTTDGRTIEVGYDEWGYNYQAHMFNGYYCDAYQNADWCQDYVDVELSMKWNEAWLSNQDCDGDGKLDRHRGYDSYIGSGAWLTNHEKGMIDGKPYTYFVKIVAAPADAYEEAGIWMTADGVEIGPVIWGSFAIIQEQSTGSLDMETYRSRFNSGLGNW